MNILERKKLEGEMKGKLEGKLEGLLEGEIKNKLETAKRMMGEGFTLDQIIRITELTGIQLRENGIV